MTIYAVRNRDGHWFHRKGYGGYGATWQADLAQARLFQKIGQARGRVTFFAREYPEFGIPEIVGFVLSEGIVATDETARVQASLAKIQKKHDEHAKRNAAWHANRCPERGTKTR